MSQPIPVVICDDSRLARKQMASALRGWNVQVTFAENGLEGLEAIRSGKGDILFLDLTMPIMDGYQVLERIRRDDLPTLVIVVSGDIQPEARQRVLAFGALEFIKKPTTTDTISEVLHRFGLLSELAHPSELAEQDDSSLELPEYYQEIANVAMGRAGELLARLLKTFVHLPIPQVEMVTKEQLQTHIMQGVQQDHLLISQGFIGQDVSGEALLLFRRDHISKACSLMHTDAPEEHRETEILMALSNGLIGAFLGSFSQQLDLNFSRATPNIIHDFSGLAEHSGMGKKSLMISIAYSLEAVAIECELLLVFTEDSLPRLRQLASFF